MLVFLVSQVSGAPTPTFDGSPAMLLEPSYRPLPTPLGSARMDVVQSSIVPTQYVYNFVTAVVATLLCGYALQVARRVYAARRLYRWDLDHSDPESRTYKKWVPPGGSPRQHVLLLLNSTELRAIDFTMKPVMPAASPPLQQVRRLPSRKSKQVSALQKQAEAQVQAAAEANVAFSMPAEIENDILRRRCW